MSRLKSSIFVQSLMRVHSVAGLFSTILNKGAEEAGAIFICHLRSSGKSDFYGQVPQAIISEDKTSNRQFEALALDLSDQALKEHIDSQLRFDPDCWVVELEGGELPQTITVIDTI